MFDKSVILLVRLVIILAAMAVSFFIGRNTGNLQCETNHLQANTKLEKQLKAIDNEIDSSRCATRDCVIAGLQQHTNNK